MHWWSRLRRWIAGDTDEALLTRQQGPCQKRALYESPRRPDMTNLRLIQPELREQIIKEWTPGAADDA